MSRTRLSLAVTVAALLVAVSGVRALAQTIPPPGPPPPTFAFDRDTEFYEQITKAIGDLEQELRRVAGWHFNNPLYPDHERVGDAQAEVNRQRAKLNPNPADDDPDADPDLLESIQVIDPAEVAQRQAEADKRAEATARPDSDDPYQDAKDSLNLAYKWLTRRLAEMAAKRAPEAAPAEPERPQAPTEEQVGLRPQATVHLEDDPRESVWLAAEGAAYWKAVLDRNDLTAQQREDAERRSRIADAGLATAKDKASKKLPADEVARVEGLGRDAGTQNGSAAEPSTEPPPAPAPEDLNGDNGQGQPEGGDGATTKDDPATASLDQVIGDELERETPGLPPVSPTTKSPETDATEEEDQQIIKAPGGQVEPPQLKASTEPNHTVTDWFSGDTGLDGCLGKVRTSTIDDCGDIGTVTGGAGGTGGKLPPIDHGPEILPFPGFEQGARGEEDGCKQGGMAAFSTCGLDTGHKPDIFTPGPINLPGMTGCGPVGVMAICTGTGGDLGGSTVTDRTDLDLDRLFDQPASPPPAAPPVQPGGASSLAA